MEAPIHIKRKKQAISLAFLLFFRNFAANKTNYEKDML